MRDAIVDNCSTGTVQCTEGSTVNGSQSLQCVAVFTEHDYHRISRQYFRGGDTPYTKQYEVFPSVEAT